MTAPALAVDTDRPTRCAFIDPDLFQTDEHGHYPVRLDQLRRLCTPCYARRACLATALADPTLTGFWGGTTDHERHRIRRNPALMEKLMNSDPLAATDADIENKLRAGKPAQTVARDLMEPLNRVLQVQQAMKARTAANGGAPQVRAVPPSPAPQVRTPAPTPAVVRPLHTPSDEAKDRANTATELLVRADRIDSKRVASALGRARKALTDLAKAVNDHEDRARAKAEREASEREAREEIARLQRQLAEAKARLGKPVGKRIANVATGERTHRGNYNGDPVPCRKGCGHVSPTPQGRAAHERFCTAAS